MVTLIYVALLTVTGPNIGWAKHGTPAERREGAFERSYPRTQDQRTRTSRLFLFLFTLYTSQQHTHRSRTHTAAHTGSTHTAAAHITQQHTRNTPQQRTHAHTPQQRTHCRPAAHTPQQHTHRSSTHTAAAHTQYTRSAHAEHTRVCALTHQSGAQSAAWCATFAVVRGADRWYASCGARRLVARAARVPAPQARLEYNNRAGIPGIKCPM